MLAFATPTRQNKFLKIQICRTRRMKIHMECEGCCPGKKLGHQIANREGIQTPISIDGYWGIHFKSLVLCAHSYQPGSWIRLRVRKLKPTAKSSLFLHIKFYWDTTMPPRESIFPGFICAIIAKLSGSNRDQSVKSEIFVIQPFI